MDATLRRQLAMGNGIGRALIGASLIAAPTVATRSWLGADGPAAKVLGRALGARDLALGAGLLWALGRDEPAHAWLVAAVLADGVDAGATLLGWSDLPPAGRAAVLALAAGSAVQMAALAAAER